ncbi:hypothetical protein [Streptomyces phaeochromogenes]
MESPIPRGVRTRIAGRVGREEWGAYRFEEWSAQRFTDWDA